MRMLPELPDAAVPELRTMVPVTPENSAFAERTVTAPDDDEEPPPETMLTTPPDAVAKSVVPARMTTLPPCPLSVTPTAIEMLPADPEDEYPEERTK